MRFRKNKAVPSGELDIYEKMQGWLAAADGSLAAVFDKILEQNFAGVSGIQPVFLVPHLNVFSRFLKEADGTKEKLNVDLERYKVSGGTAKGRPGIVGVDDVNPVVEAKLNDKVTAAVSAAMEPFSGIMQDMKSLIEAMPKGKEEEGGDDKKKKGAKE